MYWVLPTFVPPGANATNWNTGEASTNSTDDLVSPKTCADGSSTVPSENVNLTGIRIALIRVVADPEDGSVPSM